MERGPTTVSLPTTRLVSKHVYKTLKKGIVVA